MNIKHGKISYEEIQKILPVFATRQKIYLLIFTGGLIFVMRLLFSLNPIVSKTKCQCKKQFFHISFHQSKNSFFVN